jgi:superfamily II DNA/RNA helicase
LVCGLRGKDIVGIAKTGSGKTLVYLLPLIMHILKNRRREDDNAMGLILLPSRELS